ncbi:MAG: hypothetical protein DRP11_00405 [Candidatus Aenigmatarchaeota archaeon]|nr:MAG: hypothetical protein DRP11_00405 [Candidatus Aenigmarchaeota archaeon]
MRSLKRIAVKCCGGLADRYSEFFKPLRSPLERGHLKILFRTYVSIIFFFTILSSISGGLILFLFFLLQGESLLTSLIYLFAGMVISAAISFTVLYLYPIQRAAERKKSIENNLPFALNHMAAIASSGVPPYVIFKLLTGFEEYGEISKEAERIVRNVDTFGQDITTALRMAAKRTPSREFQELLNGMVSTIETGGNLHEFLKVQAQQALFDFRLKRERYLETLSTYADFYTAVMIAAPLFLVALLAIMNMIGGQIGGMSIKDVMEIGIYAVIPLTNTAFILFVHLTQPEQV